jgi:membrane protein implicated in regulation of membrane protease activity
MPEWYLLVALLGMLSALSIFWGALMWAIPVFIVSFLIVLVQAIVSAYQNTSLPHAKKNSFKYILLITFLHLIQPLARLYGRLRHGLTPWRKKTMEEKWKITLPLKARYSNIWSEKWRATEEWLTEIENSLIGFKTRVKRGGDFDKWDLQTRNGISSISRALFTIEEHGAGKQLVRMKAWTKPSKTFIVAFSVFTALVIFAALDGVILVSLILSLFLILLLSEYILDASITMHHFKKTLLQAGERWNELVKDVDIEETLAVDENVLHHSGEPILLLKNHFLQNEKSSLELAQKIN